jgi:predicted phage baseplate assembly protein
VQDFKDVTEQTPGVDIGRVEVVPLFDPTSPSIAQMPGVVTIMVIPDSPIYNTPQPDQFFLEAVCDHLQPRRLVTTELYVRGPEYKDIWVSVAIEVLGGYAAGPVREAVRQELFRFLSPLYGGRSDTGWPLGVSVVPEELEAMVARVDGVRLVNSLLLGAETDGVIEIPIEGLMLPRLVGVSVVEGDQAVPISELRSAPPLTSDPETNRKSTPIPAFPARC